MTERDITREVLRLTPKEIAPGTRRAGAWLLGAGALGLGLGFGLGPLHAGWTALLVATSLVIGLAMVGIVLSAIFQLTGARWGRAYRRMGEVGVALMPVGLLGVLGLLAGGSGYLPWLGAHDLEGGKRIWLTRPFWDVRVLFALLAAYTLSLWFFYYSARRDFCMSGVSKRLKGPLAAWLGKGIGDPRQEAERCDARLSLLAPIVILGFAGAFSLLGFDLVMALEPDWSSTLFGAWFFIGHVFSGLALLALVSIVLRPRLGLERYLTDARQRDLATLLFAFCLLNIDFLWSQYFTYWYANMPEETGYLVRRIHDAHLPWHGLSWVALLSFFFVPFFALLFRKVKQSGTLLGAVAVLVVFGIFLARFLEVAPALLQPSGPSPAGIALPLLASALVFLGMLGAGTFGYGWLLTQLPILPVGDEIFVRHVAGEEPHP